MNTVNEVLFTLIPLIAFIANLFLFFTLITAKKDASIYAFMGLLGAFILWTGGSYLMRIQFLPSTDFWWTVSLTGILLVPYMYYLLFSAYLEQKGSFLKILWGLLTLFAVIANMFDLFMTSPVFTVTYSSIDSVYTLKWPSIILVVIALLIFISIGVTIRKAIKESETAVAYLSPLFIGIGVMAVGILINTIPAFTSFPADTLGCAINAVFIYYAFYKKRMYAMSQVTSKGAVYIISLIITSIIVYTVFSRLRTALVHALVNTHISINTVLIIGCSTLAIFIFIILNKLSEGIFVKEKNRREDKVKGFSKIVSSTLEMDEILKQLSVLIREELPVSHMYICMYDEKKGTYASNYHIKSLEKNLEIPKNHPIVSYAKKKNAGFLYAEFLRFPMAKGMMEKEKRVLESVRATYIMPFFSNDELCGLTILSEKENRRSYTFEELSYLDAISSVTAVALKNAMLYEKLKEDAVTDGLTGLHNRGAFVSRLERLIEESGFQASLVLINLDDFSLYNELYGNTEGDKLLHDFAQMLKKVFNQRGLLARYGGNEFSVLLPHTDAIKAKELTEQVRKALSDYVEASTERTKKFLTFSAGICAYPGLAGNVNQLLTYANMAVYNVKRHGKNKTGIYGSDEFNKSNKDNEEELTSTIYALTAAIDAKDHYTFNHSRCVSEYASQLAAYAGLGDEMVRVVRQAGLLHDIGKIGIPDAILTKTGKLTDEEYGIMKQHVERSIEMIKHLPALDYVIPAVIGHHERYDGRGYPRGISGKDLPDSARCLNIADSFDAMVSKRSYKEKRPVEDSLKEIERCLGTQFDPELGQLFVDLVRSGKIQVISY